MVNVNGEDGGGFGKEQAGYRRPYISDVLAADMDWPYIYWALAYVYWLYVHILAICIFVSPELTAAVHCMTSLQFSSPSFSLNSSPALLSAHSFLSVSSSSWHKTPTINRRLVTL